MTRYLAPRGLLILGLSAWLASWALCQHVRAAKPDEKKAKPAASQKEKPAPKKATVVRILLRGSYPEGPTSESLFSERHTSFSTLLRRIDQTAADASVAAVLLEIDDISLGAGKADEVRQAIARLRKAGKPVYAQLTAADITDYRLAMACNEIVMAPSGMLLMPGARAEVTFYKGLLEKLGLQFDALQMGKFKGAAEPLTRSSMSSELRENLEGIVDDAFEGFVENVSKQRKLDEEKVRALVDRGLFTAEAARKAGLVDHVAYFDQFQDSLRKKLGVDQIKVISPAKKKDAEVDLSGIGGFMKFLEILGGGKPKVASREKKIAVVYAVGAIVQGDAQQGMFSSQVVASRPLIEALKSAADDATVLAIVLRVDSPGGSAIASDLIWRQIQQIKKPVIASMGNVAASGGYYISMGTKRILAEPNTITGSIGVIGGKLVTGGLYEKIGVTTEVISRGKNSGMLSSRQPFSPTERAAWEESLKETYRQFVTKAAAGREMSYRKMEELAQGRVYTGRQALAKGLIDQLGTLHDAVAEAKKAAGLKADDKIEIQVLPKPKTLFEQLFNEPSVSEDVAALLPVGAELLGQVKLFKQLLSEPTLLLMPGQVELK